MFRYGDLSARLDDCQGGLFCPWLRWKSREFCVLRVRGIEGKVHGEGT